MSLAAMPAVSVVIPTYNRADYVCQAIDSVLAQTFRSVEIIVVDDGSIDDTEAQIAARYGGRVRYHWQENQGESAARNRGIALARGDYIALLDSDDLWLPKKLERQLSWLREHPDTAAVICQAWQIDSDGKRLNLPRLAQGISNEDLRFDRFLEWNLFGPGASASVVRRHVFSESGGFDETIRYGEDWDLWLRLSHDHRLAVIPEPLVETRKHAGSQQRIRSDMKRVEAILADHLKLLGKAADRWPDDVPSDILASSILRQRLHAVVEYLVASLPDSAADHLKILLCRPSGTVLKPEGFAELLLGECAFSGEPLGDCLHAPMMLERALQKVPCFHQADELLRYFVSYYHMRLVFRASHGRDWQTVRKHWWPGVRHNPRWLRNTGVLSIGCKALLNR